MPSPAPARPGPAPDLDALSRDLTGDLWRPGDEPYDELVTPWNLAVEPRPVAVVAVADADDVARALRWAAAEGVRVAVQATGHGVGTTMDGMLLVHTGRLDGCTVHPGGWARVEAGVRWAQVLDAAGEHGLAPLCGSAPDVGVVGYLTGGGIGPAARTFGVSADRVRAFEMVTGDGVVRRVTADDEPDLFWGVRGGRDTLGVVTAVEIDLLDLPQVYAGAVYLDGARVGDLLRAWRDWAVGLPEEATTSVAVMHLPAMPDVPPELADRCVVAARFVWAGGAAEGHRVLRPVREAGAVLLDAVDVIPFREIGTVHADPVEPLPIHEVNALLRALPDEAVDVLAALTGPDSGTSHLVTEIRQLGGAIAREPAVPSALCHRDAAWTLMAVGLPVPPRPEQVLEDGQRLLEAMAPWSTGGTFPNFETHGADGFVTSYDGRTRDRLLRLAERYDPHGLLGAGRVPRAVVRPAPDLRSGDGWATIEG